MVISEDDADRLIATILDALTDKNLEPNGSGVNDLIGQWRAEIESGRAIDRKLTYKQSPGLDEVSGTPRSGTSTSGDFVGKEEFTKVEQFDLLIETLGLAFMAPQMMASRFLDNIEKFSSPENSGKAEPTKISLADGGDSEGAVRHINRENVAQSAAATDQLGKLLQELAKEAGLKLRQFKTSVEEI
ncbi:hypothetical protein [Falsihalocynthiibacter sp. CO-5D18]|uniref:hypothetical protein n=1 Tax=Falsihalocynthiibacter sp. CO-5D18 TaxID=3240872 RepID=UPI003510887F